VFGDFAPLVPFLSQESCYQIKRDFDLEHGREPPVEFKSTEDYGPKRNELGQLEAVQLKNEQDIRNDDVYEDFEETLDENSFSSYFPAKLSIGQPHPDPLVQSSSLAAVVPPDIISTLSLPEAVVRDGLLSAPQLETVIYTR
jgi:hypothetical protein